MNARDESTPSPPNGMAQDVGELTHDIVSLAELQFELFRNDCHAGAKGLLIPVVLLLGAGVVALGTVPLGLLLVAELLVQTVGLTRVAAYFIAALSGVSMAVALGVVGAFYLRGVSRVFERSREELARNLAWIKHALKRPAPLAGQPPEDG
jgi:hypothetical protein